MRPSGGSDDRDQRDDPRGASAVDRARPRPWVPFGIGSPSSPRLRRLGPCAAGDNHSVGMQLWTPRRTAAQVRVAIVGAGIAGLAAAYRLDPHCDVVLFEAEPRAGGHATQYSRTVMRSTRGFVVCNERNYPSFLGLTARARRARCARSTMSFSVRCERCDLEFSGHGRPRSLRPAPQSSSAPPSPAPARSRALLPQRPRAARRSRCGTISRSASTSTRGRYGRALTDHFLAPMGAAIWSSSPARMREMPARFFVALLRQPRPARRARRAAVVHDRGRLADATSTRCSRGCAGRVALGAAGAQRCAATTPASRSSAGDGAPRALRPGDPGLPSADQALALLADPSDGERAALAAHPVHAQRDGRPHAATPCCRAASPPARPGTSRSDDCRSHDRPVSDHLLAQPPARLHRPDSSSASR